MGASHRLRTLLLAGALAAAVAGGAHVTGVLEGLEQQSVDVRFGLRPAERPAEVAVVAVDADTFSELGWQWPFPRSRFARVVDRLRAAGVAEIVLDVQFTEATEADEDWALYEAVGRVGGVLATSETDGRGGHRVLGGPERLAEIGAVAGSSNLPHDDEGVMRRYTASVDGLPTIAAQVARRAGRPVSRSAFAPDGRAWIDFRGPPGTVPTVSFADVYRGRADPSLFRDRIVVIGASAPTLQDVHPTPVARADLMPGPEVQANAIWTALHGNPLRSAAASSSAQPGALLALLVPLAALRLGPLAAALGGVVAGAAYAGAAHLAFTQGVVVAVATPLVALLVATVTTAVAGNLLERRERRRVDEHNGLLEAAVRARTADLDALQLEIIERLGQAVDSRDEETGEHIARITTLSHRLALAAGVPADHAETIRRASAMHDVGKVAIPDRILQHPGPLTPGEREVMQTHAELGAGILAGSRSPLVRVAEVIARTHHERWDGTGYPHGLAGEEIPLEGRIVAVCDVYDALVSRRPYKDPWPHAEAMAELRRQAGHHFDPFLVTCFERVMDGAPATAADPAPEPAAAAPA